jgi:hypothetical protein
MSKARSSIGLLTRYKLLFRASTMAFGAAVIFSALGLLALIFASGTTVLGAGLLLASISGLTGYKVAISTMALIDADQEAYGWPNLR